MECVQGNQKAGTIMEDTQFSFGGTLIFRGLGGHSGRSF